MDKNFLEEILNSIQIGNALDFLKKLPNQSVKLVFTDPPYGTKTYLSDQEVSEDIWREIRRVGSDLFAIWGYPKNLFRWAKYFDDLNFLDEIIWYKYNNPIPSPGLTHYHQDIVIWGKSAKQIKSGEIREPRVAGEHLQKWLRRSGNGSDMSERLKINRGSLEIESSRCSDVWCYPSPGAGFNSHKRIHPNEKPEEIVKRIILLLTEPGDLVLDPFAGSGTIPRVCQRLERNYIGIEINETWAKVAIDRLDKSYTSDIF